MDEAGKEQFKLNLLVFCTLKGLEKLTRNFQPQ